MSEIKITRRECLESWNNTTASGAYYLIHGRVYNESRTGYYKFKFILFFDFAIDCYDPESDSDIPFPDVLENAIYGFIPDCGDLYGTPALRSFIDDCNATIAAYNERNRARRYY